MKVIYPEETLTLLAKYDAIKCKISEEYQRAYPQQDWQRFLFEDASYQACVYIQAKIMSLSTCTYQFDAEELSQSQLLWLKK